MDGDVALRTVARHIEAVRRGDDPAAMAADYAPDAVVVRGAERIAGHDAIRAYFARLPERLAGGRVVFDRLRRDGERVTFSWRIAGGPGDGTTGTDTCVVRAGRIVEQLVTLDGTDF